MTSPIKKALTCCLLPVLFFLLSCGGDDDNTKTASITGTVTENGAAASGVSILIDGNELTTTDGSGSFSVSNLPLGSHVVAPQQEGRAFSPEQQSVTLPEDGLTGIDFEREALAQFVHGDAEWELFNEAVYSVKVNNETTVQLDLAQNALWYNESKGGGIYQSITGNFTLSATVNAVKKSNNAQAVACDVCLGGIMARNPDESKGQNYVHLVTGFTPAGLGYETKNTVNSASDYTPTQDGSSMHDLRITRSGSTFTLFKKGAADTDWVLIGTQERPDLPATLQVGLNIYTAPSGAVADLSVIYKDIVLTN